MAMEGGLCGVEAARQRVERRGSSDSEKRGGGGKVAGKGLRQEKPSNFYLEKLSSGKKKGSF